MQTLNVGANQTATEYAAAEEQRRLDLRSESVNDANYFFWAAGLAALGSGLLPVRLNIFVNTGVVDLLTFYGKSLGSMYPIVLYGTAVLWVGLLLGLGFIARRGHRWAFLFGIALYGLDMLALITMFSIWAFGVHSFFVFKWFEGQRALRDLSEGSEASSEHQ